MQEWRVRYSFPLFFFAWLLFFFPGWYVLSFTKVHELQRLILRDRNTQLQVLHPAGEMSQLLELRHSALQLAQEKNVAVLTQPQDTLFPLATDRSMQRAVLFPIPVVAPNEITDQEILIMLTTEPTESLEIDANTTQACAGRIPDGFAGEGICWPLLPLR